MSDDTFSAPTPHEPATALTPTEADYDAICAAVMETVRGRWFLNEYSRRNRHADTELLLATLDRIEETLRGEQSNQSIDLVRTELMEMAKAIARAKSEICAIAPPESNGKADSFEGVDSVLSATEQAASGILAAAEQIQEVAWTMREQGTDTRLCDQLDARASEIHDACSTQDLTGQHTQKVIQVMHYLEGRINAMIDIWGADAIASNAAYARNGAAAPADAVEAHAEIETNDYREAASASGHLLVEHEHRATPLDHIADAIAAGATDVASADTAADMEVLDHEAGPAAQGEVVQTPTPAELSGGPPPRSSERKSGSVGETAPIESTRFSSYSDVMALLFPTDANAEPLPMRPQSQNSASVVVIAEPAPDSGAVVIAPQTAWPNTAAIQAMTSPALESVIVISNQDDEATARAADDRGDLATSAPDLFAMHIERSMPPGAGLLASNADMQAPASNATARAQSRPPPVVIQFDLEPLAIPVAADFQESLPAIDEPSENPLVDDRADADTEPMSNVVALLRQSASQSPMPPTATADVAANPPEGPPPQEPPSAPAPGVTVAVQVQPDVRPEPPPQSALQASSDDPKPPLDTEAVVLAAELATPIIAEPPSEPPAPARQSIEKSSQVLTIETTLVPKAASTDVRVTRATVATAPVDPLAAIAALSDEEKIAIFS